MEKKTLILVLIVIVVCAGLIFFFGGKNSSPDSLIETSAPKIVTPSDTFIDYTDPAGFSFSYPDNLSISNSAVSEDSANVMDPDIYASLQLFSNDKSGSLNIKIADTKLKSLDAWLKENQIPETNVPTEKQLGGLKAFEVKTADRLMLAAIDQAVLFTIDMPLIEQDFWMKVYDKVTKDFAFATPEPDTTQTGTSYSADEIIFEGEEVVE